MKFDTSKQYGTTWDGGDKYSKQVLVKFGNRLLCITRDKIIYADNVCVEWNIAITRFRGK